MHNRDARARGEHQTRLDTVAAWREAPYYTARERAALAWCEALTELPRAGAPDDVYAAVEAEFSPEEIAALTFAIVAINGWNRLAVGLRSDVHQPGRPRPARTAPTGPGVPDRDARGQLRRRWLAGRRRQPATGSSGWTRSTGRPGCRSA